MSKQQKEKHLQATIYKIENVKREQNFILKHLWKVIVFGIVFSFWAPTYGGSDALHRRRDSLVEKGDYNYITLVIMSALIYSVFCLLFHFNSKYQNNKKLRKLNALKAELENEIKEYNS